MHQEMYMFLSDEVGWALAEAFAGAARRGIPVRLAYDAIGSSQASEEMFEMVRKAGVEVKTFRPVAPWRKRSGILGRNHRKNLIVDGRIAFTGGMNIGAVWSRAVSGDDAWRDTHLSMEGPAAMGCDQFFKETWAKVGGSAPQEKGEFVLGESGPWKSDFVVVGGSGFGKREAVRRLYPTAFAMAEKEGVLTVPYFATE
ncbi:phospholipase D-like domain-containing protein [Akkermansiaceae bacterium]|nr:phospholipase D-like domain-containing protein [Akkermansiaceae bacterium]